MGAKTDDKKLTNMKEKAGNLVNSSRVFTNTCKKTSKLTETIEEAKVFIKDYLIANLCIPSLLSLVLLNYKIWKNSEKLLSIMQSTDLNALEKTKNIISSFFNFNGKLASIFSSLLIASLTCFVLQTIIGNFTTDHCKNNYYDIERKERVSKTVSSLIVSSLLLLSTVFIASSCKISPVLSTIIFCVALYGQVLKLLKDTVEAQEKGLHFIKENMNYENNGFDLNRALDILFVLPIKLIALIENFITTIINMIPKLIDDLITNVYQAAIKCDTIEEKIVSPIFELAAKVSPFQNDEEVSYLYV